MAVFTYIPASGSPVVICHGLAHPGEPGFYTGPLGASDETGTEWSVDPVRPIGAASARPADRGNGLHMWTLWVERRYADEDAARAAARALPGLLPRGAASVEVTGEEAGYKTVYAYTALQKLSTRRNGCSLDIVWEFVSSVPVRTPLT